VAVTPVVHPPSPPSGDKPPSPARPPLHDESSSKTVVRTLHNRPPALTDLPKPNLPSIAQARVEPAPSPALSTRSRQLEAAAAPPPPPRTPPPMPVLVVDDDHLTRMLMKRLLTRLGCSVTTAENGEIALGHLLGPGAATPGSEAAPQTAGALGEDAWAADCKYAVVFLDNQMPVLSGLETVSKLRMVGRRDLVVGVTGNALLSDQEEYIEAGVDQCV
jgi:osomolarity two-component system sensor histidine kinase SLN1